MTDFEGSIFSYKHYNGKLLAWVELTCQTDFAARTKEFQTFGDQLAMHVASCEAESPEQLLEEDWLMNSDVLVVSVLNALADKLGEKIQIRKMYRIRFGE